MTAPINDWLTVYERTLTAYTPGNEPGLVNDIVQGTRKGYEGGRRAVNDETYVSEFEVFWSLLHTNLVDLVLSDINMPDITSLDVARLLPLGTLFIFTTAYAEHTVSDERQTPRSPQPTYRDDLLAKFK